MRTAVTEIEFENQNLLKYKMWNYLLSYKVLAFSVDVFSHEVHCEYAAIGI